ncbi:hypothetical protein PPERSA_08753 [Pseudocohnilembus persalinus]|uniref:Palmitoyl protein thioesterase n=1 Tax=Pseudocohnilembus persalinus TaxID=266149 RepID=A0A0V0R7I9_PSEPJ|nr:hypothetical protein PPERSA_08753 [Pseudocohnilembus persalinus]|eukprot:KRX10451.1 hypothetical protein PPERSA_08753 [Pseudocohnilembus persalinus]
MFKIITFILAFLLIINAIEIYPVAIFHGALQSCEDEQLSNLTYQLQTQLQEKTEKQVYVKCIEYGPGMLTINRSMETQAKEACELLKQDENLTGNISVLGMSQGAMIGRYIIQQCEFQGQVKRYVGIGGPQMGGASCPGCFKGVACIPLNSFVSKYAYTEYAQENIGPAGCYHDAKNYDKYLDGNKFLPQLNNLVNYQEQYKKKIEDLEIMQLVQFLDDQAVDPPSSAWFYFFDSNKKKVVPIQDQEIYKKNLIGLKSLNDNGLIEYVQLPGGHLEFDEDDIYDYFVPALAGEFQN